jgi:hypothetical protein
VRSDGDVDFASVGRERQVLDAFVQSLASFSPHNRPDVFPTPEDALAYWLNTYNALVLQQVVDGYPYLESVRQPWLGRFFWGRAWPVGGERLTLWALEHRVLRTEFADPRIHFALFRPRVEGPGWTAPTSSQSIWTPSSTTPAAASWARNATWTWTGTPSTVAPLRHVP